MEWFVCSLLKDDPKKFWSFYGVKQNLQGFLKRSALVIRRLLHLYPSLTCSIASLPLCFRSPICIQQQARTQLATDNELHLIQTSIEEVTKALKAINPSKAYGPDQIPGRLLKECTSEIAPSLTRLINLSLRVSHVPKDWKRANIVPVFKKGNKEDIINYRPIFLLSLVSKIAERCVFDHLFSFIAGNIYPLQHGFVKGHSTITQLLDTVHRITSAIDQGIPTDFAFLDFSKAFDSACGNRWQKL